MNSHTKASPHPMLLTAGAALILFCGVGTAAIMGWIPASMGRNTDAAPIAATAPAAAISTHASAGKTHASAQTHSAPVHVAANIDRKAVCNECGVIESTRTIDTRGDGSGLGAAGGAVVGGLLGNQVGGGHGKEAMTVVGAIGGALAGNQIEKQVKATRSYEVTVRLDNGSARTIHEAAASGWRTGEHVKIVGGEIRAI